MDMQRIYEDRMQTELSLLAHRVVLIVKQKLEAIATDYGYSLDSKKLEKLLPGLLNQLNEAYKDAFDFAFGCDGLLSREDCESFFLEASQLYLEFAVWEFIADMEEPIQTLVNLKTLENQRLSFSKRMYLVNQGLSLLERSKWTPMDEFDALMKKPWMPFREWLGGEVGGSRSPLAVKGGVVGGSEVS